MNLTKKFLVGIHGKIRYILPALPIKSDALSAVITNVLKYSQVLRIKSEIHFI